MGPNLGPQAMYRLCPSHQWGHNPARRDSQAKAPTDAWSNIIPQFSVGFINGRELFYRCTLIRLVCMLGISIFLRSYFFYLTTFNRPSVSRISHFSKTLAVRFGLLLARGKQLSDTLGKVHLIFLVRFVIATDSWRSLFNLPQIPTFNHSIGVGQGKPFSFSVTIKDLH